MRLFIVISFLLFFTATPVLADTHFEAGKQAYDQGDWFNAIRILRPLAEQNDDRALVLLGNMYNDGSGVHQDHTLAFEHYKRALINQNHTAMASIATMYTQGIGVEKDFQTGYNWFVKAADFGNSAAQIMLASLLIEGHPELPSLKPDLEQSYVWYRIVQINSETPEFIKLATELAKRVTIHLTPDQILSAERKAKSWHPKPKDF